MSAILFYFFIYLLNCDNNVVVYVINIYEIKDNRVRFRKIDKNSNTMVQIQIQYNIMLMYNFGVDLRQRVAMKYVNT